MNFVIKMLEWAEVSGFHSLNMETENVLTRCFMGLSEDDFETVLYNL